MRGIDRDPRYEWWGLEGRSKDIQSPKDGNRSLGGYRLLVIDLLPSG